LAYLRAFGAYLPERMVSNEELAAQLECTPKWISDVSGIEERRLSAPGESVVDLAERAAADCLAKASLAACEIGLAIVASGSAERHFPGPACTMAERLKIPGVPVLDLPIASAGSLFAIAMAADLAPRYGNVLVVAAERMGSLVMAQPPDRGTTLLFGDGAGACVVSRDAGPLAIADIALHTDGSYAEDLRMDCDWRLEMNGRSVILQASRKIPAAIGEVLERGGVQAPDVPVFLMHQANQNLIDRVARALAVEPSRFYSNIGRYGNTSSASMLIAASEWSAEHALAAGTPVVMAAFGAGFNWGAILLRAV
jgi:3-oxoacyl-[acyl-carrier-protein] synthase III